MSLELSQRDWKILALAAEGMTAGAIAHHLGLSMYYVKNLIKHLYDVTGMSNRVELALWYLSHKQAA